VTARRTRAILDGMRAVRLTIDGELVHDVWTEAGDLATIRAGAERATNRQTVSEHTTTDGAWLLINWRSIGRFDVAEAPPPTSGELVASGPETPPR
jgi:hypothetical protein